MNTVVNVDEKAKTGLPKGGVHMLAHKVLLIEDNQADAELVAQTLRPLCQVDHIESLREGINSINDDFDVAILDLSLPDCSGIETFRHFHTHHPLKPVVILSDYIDEPLAKQMRSEGAADVVSKAHMLTQNYLRNSIKWIFTQNYASFQSEDVHTSKHNWTVEEIKLLKALENDLMPAINSIYMIAEIMQEELYGKLGHEKYQQYADDLKDCVNIQQEIAKNMRSFFKRHH